ncbi:hypothetical protein [Arthrobacter sp. Cr_A7]|uniref:hypothetical protein n=1 Tax=Arthrobacter sp. Cr_A7 TaxID=3031017 RepID=UPI0023D99EBD|nr:hypothetical protein [Arthrobacter sp. Cr_A7]MDF2049536.1 hypothetical protein [Arthrobacter sp. Cr_A7]
MIEGPRSDHAYSLAKAYNDLVSEEASDLQYLRQDPELARSLASMLSAALQAVHDVVEDDKLWRTLKTASLVIETDRIENLIGFAQRSLEPLLHAFGYRPPPPLYKMVDETEAALVVVGEAFRRRTITGAELDDARSHLRLIVKRLEERLDPRFAPRQAAPVMLAATSTLLRVLMRIIPPVVGAAVAGQFGLPPELGAAAGEGGKELVKQAGEMAAGALIGFGIDHARKGSAGLPELSDRAARFAELWISIEDLGSLAHGWAKERGSLEEFSWIRQHVDKTWQRTYREAVEATASKLKDYILSLQDSSDFGEDDRRIINLVQSALSDMELITTPTDALDRLKPVFKGIRKFTRARA